MSALSIAVRREEWEVAAYLLLLGAAKVASRLPPETLAELVALLETHGETHEASASTQAAPRPRGLDGGGWSGRGGSGAAREAAGPGRGRA